MSFVTGKFKNKFKYCEKDYSSFLYVVDLNWFCCVANSGNNGNATHGIEFSGLVLIL